MLGLYRAGMNMATDEFSQSMVDARPLAIEARGLVKRFDGALAVDGVDLAVPEGAIYGILGPNGAGKTTSLRMLLGIIEPDAGTRRVLGATHSSFDLDAELYGQVRERFMRHVKHDGRAEFRNPMRVDLLRRPG